MFRGERFGEIVSEAITLHNGMSQRRVEGRRAKRYKDTGQGGRGGCDARGRRRGGEERGRKNNPEEASWSVFDYAAGTGSNSVDQGLFSISMAQHSNNGLCVIEATCSVSVFSTQAAAARLARAPRFKWCPNCCRVLVYVSSLISVIFFTRACQRLAEGQQILCIRKLN
jgi:hypothetical protein